MAPIMCTCCSGQTAMGWGQLSSTHPINNINLPYKPPSPHYLPGNIQFQPSPDILDRLAKIELQLELLINNHKDCENERKENDEKRWRDV
jgi:hypothetical protein